MSVKNILDTKGHDVICVKNTALLREAISLLNTHNIGVVLVTNSKDQLAGILSERDIIRRALSQEIGFRDELVTKTMTKNVVSVGLDASVEDVMEMMTNSRVRHIPVVENEKIKGLISIGDVVKKKIFDVENEATVLRDYIATG
ncbi:MAG: CBS domain-containing protein [Robiginitomaculum sp.]